jgi:capsular exopolysaccharide synthesis family protein
LATEAQPKDIVQPTVINHLEVLTSGPMPPNPAELLSGSRMAAFIKWARHNYDIVVIDVPPMIAVTDAQVILPLVDGVVLVTSLGKTLKANLKRTVEMLRLGETNILGVVSRQHRRRGEQDVGYDYVYGE